MRNHVHRRGGFTLVEILCVVVILGIAAAMIAPSIGTRDDLNAAATARAVMADLTYAQNRAIATQTMHYVSFSVAGQSYAICSSMSPQTYVAHPVYLTNYITTFGTGELASSSLVSVNFNGGPTVLAFDELGAPYSYNTTTQVATPISGVGQIVVKSGQVSLTISVQQDTGQLTVQ
jgi:prepilin-type N-terminal cleavage/methylation domain-containing protein